ncbi:hypothetical protein [Streptomyces sp. t39]|nr:hypothetical protein [Streptomyces sp. t39]
MPSPLVRAPVVQSYTRVRERTSYKYGIPASGCDGREEPGPQNPWK